MTNLELVRKQIRKQFKDSAFLQKTKIGFNLLVFDNMENEVLNELSKYEVRVTIICEGVNSQFGKYTKYSMEAK